MNVVKVYGDKICVVESSDNTYTDKFGILRSELESPNNLTGVWMSRKDYVNQQEVGTQLTMDLFI